MGRAMNFYQRALPYACPLSDQDVPFAACRGNTIVIETRATTNGHLRRRRQCQECHRRFTTYETLNDPSGEEKFDHEIP
jgi:hypothetical protein